MSAPLDLDAIEKRASAATAGPWSAHRGEVFPWVLGPTWKTVCGPRETNDAEFIAHAREDVPALIARVRELEAQRTALYGGVACALDRSQEDPDLGYYLGWGTEAFRRLCIAEAAYRGETLGAVEERRREDLQPDHRRREPEVLRLRRELGR